MSSVCKVCLNGNTRLYSVENYKLRDLYKRLTCTQLNTEDARSRALCCFCYQKLLRCHTFSQMALRSARIFNHVNEMGLEITQNYITELNLLKIQYLSIAIMPSINIDTTNVESQVSKDEPIPINVDIKEEVTTEPDTLLEDRDDDTEELLSNTRTDQSILDESSFTIKGEPLTSIEIKEEVYTELDELVEIGSFPEHSTKSRLIFEEDHSDLKEEVEELLYQSHIEKTKADDTKMRYSCNNCNKIFDVQSKLNSHIRNSHSGKYSYTKNGIATTSMLKSKSMRNQKKICPVCVKVVDSKSHLIRHMRTHKGQMPFASNVCQRPFFHKGHLVERTKNHTDNTGAQVVLGPSDQTEGTQSVKMLLFLQQGEQRLITFTPPREGCTLREVLEQVNVPFSEDTHVQCMQDCSGEIDYFVSVGSSTRIEQLLEKYPGFRGEMNNSREVSTPEKSSCDPVNGSEPPGQWQPLPPRPPRPPPRYIDGMLAVCKTCGYTGFDFSRCERCKRVFTEEPKGITIAR